jgi:hypothetical protein
MSETKFLKEAAGRGKRGVAKLRNRIYYEEIILATIQREGEVSATHLTASYRGFLSPAPAEWLRVLYEGGVYV